MTGFSSLSVPEELKARIEQASRERDENPSILIASALDLLLETESLQTDEAQRRLASRTGKSVPNDRVMAWLDTWGLNGEVPPPVCE